MCSSRFASIALNAGVFTFLQLHIVDLVLGVFTVGRPPRANQSKLIVRLLSARDTAYPSRVERMAGMKLSIVTAMFIASIAYCTSAISQSGTQPDNSRANKDERSTPTAQDQSQSKPDVELAAAVRKAIVADKSLSTYAHNVKVIAREGSVTLTGPVNTESEKAKVADIAQKVSNVRSLDNRITVNTSK